MREPGVVVGLGDGTVVWVDPATGETTKSEAGGTAVRCLAASGEVLASGHDDGALCLWDWGARDWRVQLEAHVEQLFAIGFSADGTLLATAGDGDHVRVWDVVTWDEPALVGDFRTGSPVYSLAFGEQDIDELYVGTDGGPRVYDLGSDDGRILAHLDWACDELEIDRDAPAPARLRELLRQD